MLSYQKKYGFKFELLVLDYLDCLESHKKVPDRNEAELAIIKGFETLASDFDIPAWTAIQSNRSGFGAEFIEAHQSGGSIKRIQKSHFFMSVAKTQEQKEAHLANISILKARFAQDGQKFEDCIFNNDTMQIIIEDSRYKYSKTYKNLKHYDEDDKNKFDENAKKIMEKSSTLKMHEAISNREEELIRIANNDNVNTFNPHKLNELLMMNKENEFEDNACLNVETNVNMTNKHVEDITIEITNNTDSIIELDESGGVNEGVIDECEYGVDVESA